MSYEPRIAPPLPKGPVPIRPIERQTSPFEEVRARVNPEGTFTWSTDRSRIAAQRRARKVLDELDARRRGEAREERAASRNRNRTRAPGQPRERQPRIRTSSLILSDAELLQLFDQGKSCLQIERLTGISQRTIRTRAHELGVHHPPTTRAAGMERKDITAEGMQALRAQGLGWRAIAAHYGVSYATIRRHRDRAGVHPTEKGIAA
jgi:hypothetical protein